MFNGALLIVSHDRFLIKSVIEGDTELLGLDEENEANTNAEEEDKVQRISYQLRKGTLTRLVNGIQDFENSLEKRVEKLSL